MVVPVGQQAARFRLAQEGRVEGVAPPSNEVVAAAGAGVAAVERELLGAEVGLVRGLVEEFGALDQFGEVVPGGC